MKKLFLFIAAGLVSSGMWATNVTVGRTYNIPGKATSYTMSSVTNTTVTQEDLNIAKATGTQTIKEGATSTSSVPKEVCYKNNDGSNHLKTKTKTSSIGFQLVIADGYELTVSSIDVAVGTSANFSYAFEILDNAETPNSLYESSDYTMTNYDSKDVTNGSVTISSFSPALTLTGTVHAKLYVWYNGTSKYIVPSEFTITGDLRSSCSATAPGDITKGAPVAGEVTLTAAGSAAEGETWYWQDAANGTATDKGTGASKTVSTKGTYYIRSYNGSCWSVAKSITLEDVDFVANYTVVYKDGTTELGRETVEVGEHPSGIANPTKELYTFAGWENQGSAVNPTTFDGEEGVTYNFIATWTPNYLNSGTSATIDFEAGGSSLVSNVADYNILASDAGSYDGGKAEENWAFKGWKIKSAGATVKFLVPADKYIQFKFGYLNVAGTITISGDDTPKSVTGASKTEGGTPTHTLYTYNKNYDAIYTFTTGDKNAAVIKAIKMSDEVPTALDNTEDETTAVKVLRDGQIFIEKNGHVYNVLGGCVK